MLFLFFFERESIQDIIFCLISLLDVLLYNISATDNKHTVCYTFQQYVHFHR